MCQKTLQNALNCTIYKNVVFFLGGGGTYATNPLAITVLQQLQFSKKKYTSIFEYGFAPLY